MPPEEPAFFGPQEAPMYSVFHVPMSHTSGRHGTTPPILVVHSYGIEQVASYRMEVEFARAAAAEGFPVLRFHMTGCGDSFGDFADVTVDRMTEDVRQAAAHVATLGFRLPPVLLGVRLGAEIAVRAAAALGGVRALILWEPVRDARGYLEGLLRSLLISNLAQGKKTGETARRSSSACGATASSTSSATRFTAASTRKRRRSRSTRARASRTRRSSCRSASASARRPP
jgi:pimeloyl-ACP methyl ester carboxylesterase